MKDWKQLFKVCLEIDSNVCFVCMHVCTHPIELELEREGILPTFLLLILLLLCVYMCVWLTTLPPNIDGFFIIIGNKHKTFVVCSHPLYNTNNYIHTL